MLRQGCDGLHGARLSTYVCAGEGADEDLAAELAKGKKKGKKKAADIDFEVRTCWEDCWAGAQLSAARQGNDRHTF